MPKDDRRSTDNINDREPFPDMECSLDHDVKIQFSTGKTRFSMSVPSNLDLDVIDDCILCWDRDRDDSATLWYQ